jgi:hypothetical protein
MQRRIDWKIRHCHLTPSSGQSSIHQLCLQSNSCPIAGAADQPAAAFTYNTTWSASQRSTRIPRSSAGTRLVARTAGFRPRARALSSAVPARSSEFQFALRPASRSKRCRSRRSSRKTDRSARSCLGPMRMTERRITSIASWSGTNPNIRPTSLIRVALPRAHALKWQSDGGTGSNQVYGSAFSFNANAA